MKTMHTLNNTKAANGTSLKGYCKTTYDELVEKLGEPLMGHSGDGKITCEWVVQFDDKTVGTIYDWKTGKTPKEEYNWHLGGHDVKVVASFYKLLGIPAMQA